MTPALPGTIPGAGARTPMGRLSLMMLLQYAVWGAWLPLAARYLTAPVESGGLGFTGSQTGWILGLAASAGALSAPFVAGQIADRWFQAERALAALLLGGAIVQWMLASQTSFTAWLVLSVAYSVLYMPTLALSNSIAFAHVSDASRQFPKVRVWGTIGWIAASWTFPMLWLQSDLRMGWMPPFLTGPELAGVTARLADALRFSALISAGYAIFCLSLPATAPKRQGVEPLAFLAAFRMMGRPSLLVLLLASLVVSVVHNIYFMQAGPYLSYIGLADSQIGPAMSIGQFSEILMMALLGGLLTKFGFRFVLCLGAGAYVLRYGIWGWVDLPVELLVASQVLHGICYACFFATAFIYVDRMAPADLRHSAQTVFGMVLLGAGPVVAGWLSGTLQEHYQGLAGPDFFRPLWWTLAGIAVAAVLALAAGFRDESGGPLRGDPNP